MHCVMQTSERHSGKYLDASVKKLDTEWQCGKTQDNCYRKERFQIKLHLKTERPFPLDTKKLLYFDDNVYLLIR